MNRYLNYSFAVGALGSVLLVVGNLVQLTVPGDKFSEQVLTTTWFVSSAIRLIGAALMIVGFGALIAGQARKSGWFALATYSLAVINMVLQAGWMFADTFIVRTLGEHAPAVIDGQSSPPLMNLGFMLAWFLNATLMLFAIALWRTKYYRTLVWVGVLVAGLITIIPLPVDGPIYEVIIGVALATAFIAARRPRTVVAQDTSTRTGQSEPVPAGS